MQDEKFPGIFAEVENLREHMVKIMWSGFYFALTYILVSYLSYVAEATIAMIKNHPVTFSYNGIRIFNADGPWTLKRVAGIFLSAPLLGLLISLLATLAFKVTSVNKSHLKLFYYWLIINGFVLFYSYFFTGMLFMGNYYSVFYTGFATFFVWAGLGTGTIIILLLILALLALTYPFFTFGLKTIIISHTINLIQSRKGRKIIFINSVLLPFIFGAVLVALATFPMDIGYQAIRMLCYPIVFTVLFVWLSGNQVASVTIRKGGLYYQPLIVLLIASSILIAVARLLLSASIKW